MKKILTILSFLAIAVLAPAQQVEEVQRTLVAKRTATWCPPCGSWGWTLMDEILADNAEKAVIIAAHENGSNLSTQTSEDITANWGTFAQPTFFVDGVNQNAASSNVAAKRIAIKTAVDDNFLKAPIVNVGFEPFYENGAIIVDAKVKFFQPAEGDYYLSIYLLEDAVFSNQAGTATNNIHDRVLQYNFSENSWGQSLTIGPVVAGTEFQQSFSLLIGDPTGYEYHVVGIIWKLENGKYFPVNTWSTTTIELVSSTGEIGSLAKFEVYPSIASTDAKIFLELTENQPVVSVDVFDVHGRKVANFHDGSLPAGQHSFEINREIIGGNGQYFIRFSDGINVRSERVIFQ